MTYRNVKEKAANKARDKKNKQKDKKTKPRTDYADAIDAGPGVYAVNGINVQRGERNELMPTWTQGSFRYHINLQGGDRDHVYHVTRESNPRIQYFFTGTGTSIESVFPNKKERGKSTQRDPFTDEDVTTKLPFNQLPSDVQDFVKNYWSQILG
jgi:hypothetical protein